jgi:F-type H+-transporting ATPase subunit b
MSFNPWTFLFEVLNFVVLAAVLYRLLYRPLHEAIDRRREAAARAQAEADKAHEQAVQLQQQLHTQLVEVEQRSETVLRQARERAETEGKKLLAETESALQRRREEASQTLEREREQAWRALRSEMTDLAVGVVERLLRESCDRTLNGQLALRLVEELQRVPADRREALRGQWRPEDGAVLESAGELDEAAARSITEAVAALLAQPVTLVGQTIPTLLGGVRLRLGGQVWDASLAGQVAEPAVARGEESVPCTTVSNI